MRSSALALLALTALAGALSASEKPAVETLEATRASRPRGERPLPSFQGFTPTCERLSISEFIGDRLLLFCFDSEVPEAGFAARAVAAGARRRSTHNFAVVGVGRGPTAMARSTATPGRTSPP